MFLVVTSLRVWEVLFPILLPSFEDMRGTCCRPERAEDPGPALCTKFITSILTTRLHVYSV